MTIVQGNNQDFATVETDADGKFWVNGFQFNDSSEFFLQAKTKKGKLSGTVSITHEDVFHGSSRAATGTEP